MFDVLLSVDGLISLLSLTALEVVLGIDNIIFVSIIAGRLPQDKQKTATNIGLAAATVLRILLLFLIGWISQLNTPLFEVFGVGITGKGLILIAGGLFLLAKSTSEIHGKIEGSEEDITGDPKKKTNEVSMVIIQIILINIVFSFDSILTAIGLVKDIPVMIASVILSLIVMILFIGPINNFVNKHPTIKMLALAFLIMIGVMLIMEGLHHEVPKGYVYFSMGFALGVELLNMRIRSKKPNLDMPINRGQVENPNNAGNKK